jgi:transcriptional regulator with XRE-family HTH domain
MPMQPATLLIDDVELVEKIKENPLYIYRTAQASALRNIAARLGRSQTTVSKWEDGSAYPTDDNMALLAKLMKVDLDKLKTQWREWFNKYVMTNEVNKDGNKGK